jgi:hypothetical protein
MTYQRQPKVQSNVVWSILNSSQITIGGIQDCRVRDRRAIEDSNIADAVVDSSESLSITRPVVYRSTRVKVAESFDVSRVEIAYPSLQLSFHRSTLTRNCG